MKKIEENKNLLTVSFVGVIVITLAANLCSFFLNRTTSIMYKEYYENLKPGYIAEENVFVKSSIDIIDEEATKTAKESAVNAVLPVFTYDNIQTMQIYDRFAKIKESGKYDITVSSVAYNIVEQVCLRGLFDKDEVENIEQQGYSSISLKNSSDSYESVSAELSDVLCSENLKSFILSELSEVSGLTENQKNSIVSLVCDCVTCNIRFDKLQTEYERKTAYEETLPVIISLKKGDLLIEKDKVIQQNQLDLLRKIEYSGSENLYGIMNNAVFSLIGFSVLFLFLYRIVKTDKYHGMQYVSLLIFFSVLVICSVFFELYFASLLSVGFIFAFMPIVFLPVLMTDITGNRSIGFISVLIVVITASILPGTDITTLFYIILCGFVSVVLTRFVHKRLDTILQLISIIVSSLLITLCTMFISGYSFDFIEIVSLAVVANIIVAQLLILVLIPLLEKIFNLPTVFRMHELAYSDSSLLVRLYQAAPGTYTHSQCVATLAQNGAKEIGANDLIARVGALYHDIGKTDYPEYFVENQTGENKHDDINPSLSASIIKSHVKVGYDKGKEAKLPLEVLHIIESHHGNDVIQFFYNEALKEKDREIEHVQSGDYSYNADIPSSKECAIVMLADSVEAASRSVQDPTPAKYTKLINQIFLRKIEHGQLTDCKLSMNELETLKQSFLNSLTAMNHSRIKYPDGEEKK